MRFLVSDKEPPLMKDDLESVGGPIQRLQFFSKKKWSWKFKKVCPQPYIYMTHNMHFDNPTQKSSNLLGLCFELSDTENRKSNSNFHCQICGPGIGTEATKADRSRIIEKNAKRSSNWSKQPASQAAKKQKQPAAKQLSSYAGAKIAAKQLSWCQLTS